jgi:hypothetical protein
MFSSVPVQGRRFLADSVYAVLETSFSGCPLPERKAVEFFLKKHPVDFEARIALEAMKEARTTGKLCSRYGIHVTMPGRWRQQPIAQKNISLLPGFAPTLRAGMRNYHMFIKEQEY